VASKGVAKIKSRLAKDALTRCPAFAVNILGGGHVRRPEKKITDNTIMYFYLSKSGESLSFIDHQDNVYYVASGYM